MVDASVQTEKFTFEDYDRLYDEIGTIELIEGEIVGHRFQPYITALIGHDLFRRTLLYEDSHKMGMALVHYTYFLIDKDNMISGVRQVWVIDPKTKTITIREGDHTQELITDDTLSGGDIIPDFEIPVKNLFE